MMFNTIIKIFLDVLLPLLDICTDIQFTIELKMHKDPLFIGSGNIYHMITPVFTWSVGMAYIIFWNYCKYWETTAQWDTSHTFNFGQCYPCFEIYQINMVNHHIYYSVVFILWPIVVDYFKLLQNQQKRKILKGRN